MEAFAGLETSLPMGTLSDVGGPSVITQNRPSMIT